MTVKRQKSSGARAVRSTKPGASARSARGTKTPKKKKGRRSSPVRFRTAVVVAFLVGMAAAFVFSWTLYETRGKFARVPHSKEQRGAISAPGHALSGEPGQAVRGRAVEALPPLERNRKVSPARDLPPLPRIAGSREGISPPGELPRPPASDSGGTQHSGKSARENLYEEGLAGSLGESIRQVDYALTQAGLFLKLPASHIRVVQSENRLNETEPYRFQQVEILPGVSSRPFIAALRGTLNAWAEQASLSRIRENRWAIALNGVQTHILQLYPGRGAFAEDSAPAGEGIRRRAAGEPARLVIVLDDLGEGFGPIRRLLALNYPVTFAFWPHGANTREGAVAAHAAGREILVHQPMEPLGYPRVQPGPDVLRAGMGARRIREIVEKNIARVPHAVGLNNHMGSQFTQDAGSVDAVLNVLRDRGLFMLDSVTHAHSVFYNRARALGVRAYRRGVFLDVEATREKVLEELKHAERIALLSGQAIAIGHPLPGTLAALEEWQHLRDPSVIIVPLSELQR